MLRVAECKVFSYAGRMKKIIAAAVPYAAVGLGMYIWHNAWLTILLYHAGIIGFALSEGRSVFPRLRWHVNKALLIGGMLFCSLAGVLIYFLWPWIQSHAGILPEWMAHYGLTGRAWLLFIPYFSVVHPLLEEVHWRALAPAGANRFVWADFVFAGYHVLVLLLLINWVWLILVFAGLASVSFGWRVISDRDGHLLVPVLTHAVADCSVLIGVHFLL